MTAKPYYVGAYLKSKLLRCGRTARMYFRKGLCRGIASLTCETNFCRLQSNRGKIAPCCSIKAGSVISIFWRLEKDADMERKGLALLEPVSIWGMPFTGSFRSVEDIPRCVEVTVPKGLHVHIASIKIHRRLCCSEPKELTRRRTPRQL